MSMWGNASGWGMGANLLGMGLNAFGQHQQGKENEKAMGQAQEAMDNYNMQMDAYNQQQAEAAHGAAMSAYNAQRERELMMLKDQGATQDQLYEHDQKLGEEFMAQVASFSPENAQAAIDANTEEANEEQTAGLEQAQAEQGEVTAGSSSFQEAAAKAMEGANEGANANSSRMAGLTGVTRMRDGENKAGMQMGVLGSNGGKGREFIQKMGDLRQRRLGYAPPSAPSGPRDTSGMPQEPNMEIETGNKGNWASAIGSLLSSGGNMYNQWQRWGK